MAGCPAANAIIDDGWPVRSGCLFGMFGQCLDFACCRFCVDKMIDKGSDGGGLFRVWCGVQGLLQGIARDVAIVDFGLIPVGGHENVGPGKPLMQGCNLCQPHLGLADKRIDGNGVFKRPGRCDLRNGVINRILDIGMQVCIRCEGKGGDCHIHACSPLFGVLVARLRQVPAIRSMKALM